MQNAAFQVRFLAIFLTFDTLMLIFYIEIIIFVFFMLFILWKKLTLIIRNLELYGRKRN
jgi:hypothetical protein